MIFNFNPVKIEKKHLLFKKSPCKCGAFNMKKAENNQNLYQFYL